MATYRLLLDGTFLAKEILCLTHAYEDALRVRNMNRSDRVTKLIAKKITEVASRGETSPGHAGIAAPAP
jgi:hypothetical protein